jgi:signal transduction histidine kinase
MRRSLLRPVLFAGSALLLVGVFVYSQLLIARLTDEINTTTRLLARFCAQASFPATTNLQISRLLSDVIAGIEFPLVITDAEGIPRAWRRIEVDQALVPRESLDSLQMRIDISPVIRERIDRVRARAQILDKRNTPIAMMSDAGELLGRVHYGEPPVLNLLRWLPITSLSGVALLLLIGFSGLAGIRSAEQRTIWVGMAKETAHQLGTPISALLGWLELLRHRIASAREPVPAAELEETLDEMTRDVERLNKVAQRFSRVGSAPTLGAADVRPVVRDVVGYMRKRAPRDRVEITDRYDDVPAVPVNAELLEWAVENLVSNAINALDQQQGRVEVTVERVPGDGSVDIAVRDTGKGMTPAEQRRAFDPGYTTRRRGWGLGLPLARRVVEEYHRGRLFIRASAPGQGTTMVIRLKP